MSFKLKDCEHRRSMETREQTYVNRGNCSLEEQAIVLKEKKEKKNNVHQKRFEADLLSFSHAQKVSCKRIGNTLKYGSSFQIAHVWRHAVTALGNRLNVLSHKNKWMKQMTRNMFSLSARSLRSLLTGSVWRRCQCLDSTTAYLHQSVSQLDREEKDFPAQLCQWVSEIYSHKSLLDWEGAWAQLETI